MSGPARPSTLTPVSLGVALQGLVDAPTVGDAADVAVSGIALGSASVRDGDLYAALPGAKTHGARYALAAIDAGARAILTDPAGRRLLDSLSDSVDVPVIVVDVPRSLLGVVAARIYGDPASRFILVGVTGTQGKTTLTQLLAAGAAAGGRRTAVIGTMGTWVDGRSVGSSLTTPEAPDLHALFAVMRERGVQLCAMEVSSHALVMGRVDGVVFDLAVFTNLGRDHLDFHHTVEDYFAAKAQLFTPRLTRRALVNVDDAYGARLAGRALVPTHTLTTDTKSPGANWQVSTTAAGLDGSQFLLTCSDHRQVNASVRLPGAFNVANAAMAIAALAEVGLDLSSVAAGVASVRSVAGRMEDIVEGQPFSVIVDYAHKPDAVSSALEVLRSKTTGRVVVVLGAGGDRDQGKRPIMGEIAARLSDLLIVTDDNPRNEDPARIRADIISGTLGAKPAAQVVEIGDRAEAIRYALTAAREGDCILIAGKGHETGQQIGAEIHPFDDRETARQILRVIASTGAAS